MLLSTPALNLTNKVCGNRDRGLLGVAVDPAFTTNHQIFLYYTYNKFANACPTQAAQTPVNRVSRFVLGDSNVVDAASETVLIDNVPSYNGDHNSGDLQFGKDGNLYVSIGDGGCDYNGSSGSAAANDASRDTNVLLGKVLRVTPAGGIPAGNPYPGQRLGSLQRRPGDGRDAMQRDLCLGLAQSVPHRLRPQRHGDPVLHRRRRAEHVGGDRPGRPGADYGWNVHEGHSATSSTTDCGTPPAGMSNPIFDYGHADGCTSITGGAFVPNGVWPSTFDGRYLFSDYVCGRIFQLVSNGSGGFDLTVFADGLGASSAVDLAFGPYGSSKALYYTTYAAGGAIRRIVYNPGNRAPVSVHSGNADVDHWFNPHGDVRRLGQQRSRRR